ncbi:MAG: hypothetical protein AAF708_03220 [Deinococcota bacterium]
MIGSVWNRWDLHIHTPASFQHDFKLGESLSEEEYSQRLWDEYIDTLESELDVPAVGITDYFSIEGYKKVLEYRQNDRLKNFELILPNIEFRTDIVITKEGEKTESPNFHLIFSDDIPPEQIEKNFLERLSITLPNNEKRPLCRASLEELGQMLKQHEASFRKHSDYFVGCMNTKVNVGEIEKVLSEAESIFGGKYLKVLDPEGFNGKDWKSQAHNP